MTGVERLEDDRHAGRVGDLLGRAFASDPVWTWIVRGTGRERRLTRAFGVFAGSALRVDGGQVLVSGGSAAAIWLPPGRWKATVREMLRSGPRLGPALRGGTFRGLKVQSVIEKHHPPEPHWYLEALGTVPEARGRGVGGTLLQPVLDRCDEDGVLAYLESSNPRNLPFYERHGFVRGEPLPLPAGCPVITPMRREPR